MRETLLNIKNQLFRKSSESVPPAQKSHVGSEYLEVPSDTGENRDKVRVQQFVIQDFEDIKPVLDALRMGNTIALVNIQHLKDRDIVELKRAVNKLKKTCDAIGGDIAGFGDDYLVVTPEFAYIHRGGVEPTKQSSSQEFNSNVDF